MKKTLFALDEQMSLFKLTKNHNIKSHRDRGFATVVPNREANTIIPIIVRPGSIIHTDEARFNTRFNNEEYGFTHLTVCHKFNFVDPESGIHTQL